MKTKLLNRVHNPLIKSFALATSLLCLILTGCPSSSGITPASTDTDNPQNQSENIYTVDLNRFPEVNDKKNVTFDKQTKTVTVTAPRNTSLYAWLDLDISDYNIVKIKYKVLGDYGFHLVMNYADERYDWFQENYCPSYITEMVFPLIEDQSKLNGIAIEGPYNINFTKFIVDSITFEKVANPVKTDVFANTNNETVIDTGTNGTINENLSAWDFVKTMGAGFDYGIFGLWPQEIEYGMDIYHPGLASKPSKELIHSIKERGFKTIRLQTNPGNGMLMDKNYTINPGYLKAIKEFVDWCMEEDLYVAICGPFAELTVHDVYLKKVEEGNIRFGGYYVIEDTKEESKKFIEAVWRQYAQAFNNSYDEHLIFENFNEPIHIKHDHAWMPDPDCAECKKDFALLNEYNQLIVDTIRSTGGNNANRFIMIESLAANTEALCNELFELPADQAENKLIPTLHFYQMGGSPKYSSMFYTDSIKEKALNIFELLDEAYFSKHIPVCMSEIGASRAIPILERINCIKDFMEEVTKPNRSCSTMLHTDFDIRAEDWFCCYLDCWNLEWFDTEYLDTYINGAQGKEFTLSDEFIKENEVKVESIVGKNLLKEPVEIRGEEGGTALKGDDFIRSRPENYKLEFEVEKLSSKARIHLGYNTYKGVWTNVMARDKVSLISGGTLDDVMIMVEDDTVVVYIDNDTSCEFETGGELYILGEDIIINSVKVIE